MTDALAQWFVLDVNPYPWKVPPFSPGRKGNRLFVKAGRDEGLHTYKQAIAEQLEKQVTWKIEGPVAVFLYFWRNVETYTSQRGRKTRKHEADTTNMQKATEDALQGYLFDNDAEVVFIQSQRIEQAPGVQGMVVVCVLPFGGGAPTFPDAVQSQIDELKNRYPLMSDNSFNSEGEVPF